MNDFEFNLKLDEFYKEFVKQYQNYVDRRFWGKNCLKTLKEMNELIIEFMNSLPKNYKDYLNNSD